MGNDVLWVRRVMGSTINRRGTTCIQNLQYSAQVLPVHLADATKRSASCHHSKGVASRSIVTSTASCKYCSCKGKDGAGKLVDAGFRESDERMERTMLMMKKGVAGLTIDLVLTRAGQAQGRQIQTRKQALVQQASQDLESRRLRTVGSAWSIYFALH